MAPRHINTGHVHRFTANNILTIQNSLHTTRNVNSAPLKRLCVVRAQKVYALLREASSNCCYLRATRYLLRTAYRAAACRGVGTAVDTVDSNPLGLQRETLTINGIDIIYKLVFEFTTQ